ncbi:MAG: T9SS type A sorting domain-containing protein, partial [Bacteroidota bacterium]
LNTLTAQIDVQASTCGEQNGQIEINAMDGTPPYQYSLDDIEYNSNPIFQNLEAGEYTIYIMDANQCKISILSNNIDPSQEISSDINVSPVTCFGDNNGKFTVENIIGEAPFQFSLNEMPFTSDSTFLNLAPQVYALLIKDNRGCDQFYQIQIKEPDSLYVDLNYINDTIFSMVSGGIPPINYTWNNDAIDSIIVNPQDSTYTLTVRDANNCVAQKLIQINTVKNENLSESSKVEVFPNPSREILFLKMNEALNDGATFEVYSINGRLIQVNSIDNRPLIKLDITSWKGGTYILKLRTLEGISVSKVVILP